MSKLDEIQISRKVRPIRLAFIVNHNEKKILERVLYLNSLIWGGRFNYIIPFTRRATNWFDGSYSAKDMMIGYIESLEPDFIVCSNNSQKKYFKEYGKKVINLDDILDFNKGSFGYSISMFDIYDEQYQKTFKFNLKHPPKSLIARSSNRNSFFVSACFGAFPDNKELNYFKDNFAHVYDATEKEINQDNFFDYFRSSKITPLNSTGAYLDLLNQAGRNDRILFLLNPSSVVDIIDFWNLRAIGKKVIPVPLQWFSSMAKDVTNYINQNHVPIKGNAAGLKWTTTALKSRSTSTNDFKKCFESLDLENNESLVMQNWYPRVWDRWASEYDRSQRANLVHLEDRVKATIEDGRINFDSALPKFETSGRNYITPSWVNVINLNDYGRAGKYATVFPAKFKNINKVFKSIPRDEYLSVSSEGIINCLKESNSSNHWHIPTGVEMFNTWFSELKMESKISIPGEISIQMMKVLESFWYLRQISHEKIIKLLDKMAAGHVERVYKEDDGSKKIIKSKMASRDDWWNLLLNINGRNKTVTGRHLGLLTEKIFKIGIKLECNVCSQSNWYSMKDVDDRVQCSRCLDTFDFPKVYPPKNNWYYQTHGPFSTEDYCRGSYTVLLSIKYLCSLMDSNYSWAPSMDMKDENGQKLECDFALLRKENVYRDTHAKLLFGECKSYGEFKKKDIDRMKELAEKFPSSTLVFSTLKKDFSEAEKKRISKLVRWAWKGVGANKVKSNVLILTGVELFADFVHPSCWTKEGGKHKEFAKTFRRFKDSDIEDLCEATQKLYLDMESYWDWRQSKARKKK